MKKLYSSIAIISYISIFAQFTSPNNGANYSLNTLALASNGSLINNGDHYLMTENITISATDALIIDQNATIRVSKDVLFSVFGTYQGAAGKIIYTADVDGEYYKGIRFEESSNVKLINTTIEKGGGIRINTSNFMMDNCVVQNNTTFSGSVTSSSAIQFGSVNNMVIKNSKFLENSASAIGSGANIVVSGTIQSNYFNSNNTANLNRPQINLGPAGTSGINIINNDIIGNRNLIMTGGISASALLGGPNNIKIENNRIKDNRYGITVAGNSSYGTIAKNIIEDNNTQHLPMQGGSGINLIGSGNAIMDIKVSENEIRNNLWGVTLQGTAQANFGSNLPGKENIGKNKFKNNTNGGQTHALFNNTPNNIEAQYNCWREDEVLTDAMVEAVITHKIDDATLGLVNFATYQCTTTQGTNETKINSFSISPNPSNGTFSFSTKEAGQIEIIDFTGKTILRTVVNAGQQQINLNVIKGLYILKFNNNRNIQTSKIIIN